MLRGTLVSRNFWGYGLQRRFRICSGRAPVAVQLVCRIRCGSSKASLADKLTASSLAEGSFRRKTPGVDGEAAAYYNNTGYRY